MIHPSVVIICSDSSISCLFICAFLSFVQRSTASFSRPLASLENFFILSLFLVHSLIPPRYAFLYLCLLLSKTQLQKTFSPNAGALSLWHSLLQQAYGRMLLPRTNLIPSCPTILFLSNCFDLLSTASEFSLFLCSDVDSGPCRFVVVQNWRIPPQNANHLEEVSRWTEQSFFPCQLIWLSAQFSAFAQTRGWFVSSSLSQLHSSTTASFDFIHSLTPPHDACRIPLLMLMLALRHSLPLQAYGRVRVPWNLDSRSQHCPEGELMHELEVSASLIACLDPFRPGWTGCLVVSELFAL